MSLMSKTSDNYWHKAFAYGRPAKMTPLLRIQAVSPILLKLIPKINYNQEIRYQSLSNTFKNHKPKYLMHPSKVYPFKSALKLLSHKHQNKIQLYSLLNAWKIIYSVSQNSSILFFVHETILSGVFLHRLKHSKKFLKSLHSPNSIFQYPTIIFFIHL